MNLMTLLQCCDENGFKVIEVMKSTDGKRVTVYTNSGTLRMVITKRRDPYVSYALDTNLSNATYYVRTLTGIKRKIRELGEMHNG